MVYNSDEKIEFSQNAKAILEIWEGDGNTPDKLHNTDKLDRERRRYITIVAKHIVKDKELMKKEKEEKE